MFSFLKTDSNVSSMRVCVFILTIAVFIMIDALAFHIVMNTLNQNEIEWAAMGGFVIALGGFVTAVLYNKVLQSRVEATAEPDSPKPNS